ncbi:MAG: hypothetical protein KBT31_02785, partial [Firmicutes bacterium]|nr:hypothetical protein [Candidatus Colimorpha enterica]
MSISEKIKKSLYRAAAFFTAAVFALSILFYLTDGTVTLTVTPSNLTQIFAFCLVLSFSFLLFDGKRNVWLSALFQLIA